MKKGIIVFIIVCNLLIIFKYVFSDYKLSYKVDTYDVNTYKQVDRVYYELSGKYNFNFDLLKKMSRKNSIIKSIKVIEDDNIYCIYPTIVGIKTYPLCIENGVFTDYNLIDNELLKEYKTEPVSPQKSQSDFVYYNNLSSNTYIALWNYKGYYVMNGKSYNNYTIISKDKYDNSLAFMRNSFIYMPNYDQDHVFNELIKFDITSGETEIIELSSSIDYDSYIVGIIKNKLYIFDNKQTTLYSYNFRKSELKIEANNQMGYIKYSNGEFVSCSKSEYINNKITYSDIEEDDTYNYSVNNGVFKTIKNNKKISQKVVNEDSIIVDKHLNNLYYINDNSLYKYNPEIGHNKVLYYYELNFNKQNTVFVYNN